MHRALGVSGLRMLCSFSGSGLEADTYRVSVLRGILRVALA